MPYKDPEKARENKRSYYQSTREQQLEQQRLRREREGEAGRERRRAASRQRYWDKREQMLAQSKAWREANPERVRENMRRWRENGGDPHRRRKELTTKLWNEQGGRCYLCERPVAREDAHLDHDHRCCPRLKFCSYCVRGVACRGCNHVVGNAEDDPDRLELVARNLRAKLAEIDVRLAAKLGGEGGEED